MTKVNIDATTPDCNARDLYEVFWDWCVSKSGRAYRDGMTRDGLEPHPILAAYIGGERWEHVTGDKSSLLSECSHTVESREQKQKQADWAETIRYDRYANERTTGWMNMLQMTGGKTPQPLNNVTNCLAALRYAPAFAGVFRFNQFSQNIEIAQRPPWANQFADFDPYLMQDVDVIRLQSFLQVQGLRNVAVSAVQDAVLAAAHDASYHPIAEYPQPRRVGRNTPARLLADQAPRRLSDAPQPRDRI